jgi:CubicO group peptidase (beta-lactamase class C family)
MNLAWNPRTSWIALLWVAVLQSAHAGAQLGEALEALRRGSAGPELAGIVLATADRHGTIRSLASGCGQFQADGATCRHPLRPDSLMRVASITKLVTAVGIHRLASEGRLSLESDVGSLLGLRLRNPAHAARPITLRQLLNHTSSIIDGEQYWVPWPQALDPASDRTHRFDPEHAPGAFFRYANYNYVLLGQIIERTTATTLAQYLVQHQLQPLQIRAGLNWQQMRPPEPDRVATLYRRQSDDGRWQPSGPWLPQVDDFGGASPSALDLTGYRPGHNASVFSPHGGLRISLPDLVRWYAQLDSRTLHALMRRPVVLRGDGLDGDDEQGFYRRFGAGAQGFDWPGIGRVWGHFGEAYGLRAALLRRPASGRVWAYAITGYGDAPERYPSAIPGLDRAQAAALSLLACMGATAGRKIRDCPP